MSAFDTPCGICKHPETECHGDADGDSGFAVFVHWCPKCGAMLGNNETTWKAPESLKALCAQVAQLQVQLAGCAVAAGGGTTDDVLAKPGDYGWSPAYHDVLVLRQKYDDKCEALQDLKYEIMERNERSGE
jgi:hypothetical protein